MSKKLAANLRTGTAPEFTYGEPRSIIPGGYSVDERLEFKSILSGSESGLQPRKSLHSI